MVDQIHAYIASLDLPGLVDYWSHLELHLFAPLDVAYAPCVRRLHASLLRAYLACAVQGGRADRVGEFFERMTPSLQAQLDWRDWFSELVF